MGQIRWGASIAITNVAIFAVVDAALARHLDYSDRWATRLALSSALLLLDNLVVLWWYAGLTARIARSNADLFRVASDQFDLAKSQYDATERRLAESQRPYVVIEWQLVPRRGNEGPDGWRFVAKNIGTGPALNVLMINLGQNDCHPIGTIAAGAEQPLPQGLIEDINYEAQQPNPGQRRRLLVAETVAGDVLIVSDNRVDLNFRMTHRMRVMLLIQEDREGARVVPLAQRVRELGPAFNERFTALFNRLD